jgi:hypothetical protein
VDGGVREDDVEGPVREGGEVALPEREAAARVRGGPGEHRAGRVHADRLPRAERLVGEAGELPRPAAEIEDAGGVRALDEREQIVERGGPLAPEFPVLIRVPDVARLACQSV